MYTVYETVIKCFKCTHTVKKVKVFHSLIAAEAMGG